MGRPVEGHGMVVKDSCLVLILLLSDIKSTLRLVLLIAVRLWNCLCMRMILVYPHFLVSIYKSVQGQSTGLLLSKRVSLVSLRSRSA